MIGKTISHYKILEKLGGGGMGVVYKARDTRLDRFVALKFLAPHVSADDEEKLRFIHEAKAASALQHPNICTIYEINETDEGRLYISMEHISGKTLKEKIQEGPLTVEETLDIVTQAAQGLEKAQKKGIVHRDIKPANIMVTDDGVVKIVDFGLAKLAGQTKLTKTGFTLGTVAYMSPEQTQGSDIDLRTDIWALGVIFYEMLAGDHPFKGDYEQAVVYSILNEDPKPITDLRPEIPAAMEQVVSKALEKMPDERYQNTEALLDDLKSISAGIVPDAIKVRLRKERLRRRKRTLLFAGGAGLIIAMAAIALWQFLSQKAAVAPRIENSIAVITFENLTGDASQDILQRVVPSLLITNLENIGFLHVATWDRLRDLMKQLGKGDEETIDKDLGYKLCRIEGIKSLVLGQVMKVGDIFATEVSVYDVETEKLLKSYSAQGEGINSIIKIQIDELSREIALGVGITREEIASAELNIAEVTTTSMEAYNYFLQGRKDWYSQYLKDAIIRLEKAVELDSNFAMAYLYLGFTYYLAGEDTKGRESFEKANALSDKMSEKERLFIEAEYAHYIQGFDEKRLENYKKIVEKYPREKQAHLQLSKIYRKRDMYSEVIKHAGIVLALDPSWADAYEEMAFAYANTGDNERALEYLEKGLAAIPGDPNMNLTTGHFYVKMGRIDEAIRKFKDALDIKPDFNIENFIAYAYAMKEDYEEMFQWIDKFIANHLSEGKTSGYILKGFYHFWLGSFDQAVDEAQKACNITHNLGHRNWTAEYLMGYFNYERGEFDLAKDQIQSWHDGIMERTPQEAQDTRSYASFWLYQPLGAIELKRENIDSARSHLIKLEALMPKMTSPQKLEGYYWLLGEILLAEGSYDEAISVLEDCPRMKMPWLWLNQAIITYNFLNINSLLAQAYKQKGDLDKAIEVYERLTDPKPENRDGRLIRPENYYYLAECYEMKGRKAKAIKLYEKCLTLWKNADEDLPEKQDAKMRLARLRG
jgi:tetratricopeptide (TPR) repeat protein